MAQKRNKTKTNKVKPTTKAEITTTKAKKVLVEEVIEKEPEITGYLTPISLQREPMEKNIPVAAIFHNKNAGSITLECYVPSHEANIEMIIGGDISVETAGNIKMVSKSESPESWILNLHKSREFSGNPFIAGEAQPTYEA